MNIKRLLQPVAYPTFPSAALLFLRLVAGSAFILHGSMKIQNPFGWMGPHAGTPAVLQFLAAFSEFGGGIAWILGLLTPLASLGIISLPLFFAFAAAARAEIYYVDPGGSDSAAGSASSPWATIQKGCETAAAGDSVIVRPGVYHERVACGTQSGTEDQPDYNRVG